MRKAVMLVAVAMLALGVGVAGTAGAAQLNWNGTMTIELGDFPTIPVTGGGVATVNGTATAIPAHLSTLQLKASNGGLVGGGSVPVTDPKVAANGITSIRIKGTMGSGTLAPISGNAASTVSVLSQKVLPIRGYTKICVLQGGNPGCLSDLDLIHTKNSGATGAGIGGLLLIGSDDPFNAIRISIEAAPWTIKTRTSLDQVSTVPSNYVFAYSAKSAKGFVHEPSSGTGVNGSTTADLRASCS
jgi:hypothetical protein